MESYEDYFNRLRLKADNSNKAAIGYPVNRQHAVAIDTELLGIAKDSMATTYLNNIASPYEYGTYVSGHIKELEIELIKKLAEHFGIGQTNHFGYITYGGTEANLAAIWWHRKFLSNNSSSQVTLMCSKYSHYSLKKIADLLQLNLVQIEASEYEINLDDLETKLCNCSDSIIFVTNFGNTVYGAIDNVLDVYSLLQRYKKNQFKIHGDGAIYGLLIPYMPQYKNSIFNYLDTLSFSGHKFLGSYSISGAVLTKRDYLKEVFHQEDIHIGYIQKAIDVTISGSRQGFYIAELYLLICEALKYDGQQQKLEGLWNNCLELANWFYASMLELLTSLGYTKHCVIKNQLRIVIPKPSTQEKTDYLGQKYGLMPIGDSQLGIYVFPRIAREYLEKFLRDYKNVMDNNNIQG